MDLIYKHAEIGELQLNQCTLRWTGDGFKRWLMLWFRVTRETDGVEQDFAVPVNPGGNYQEAGPGGKTWGFNQNAEGVWQVSPSINVLVTKEVHPGPHPTEQSLWHQTPDIVGVPVGIDWGHMQNA